MIPRVFVSSTIEDLQHLRGSVRDAIEEIGYDPIMAEYGDVGYLSERSVEESCYAAMRNCDLAVLLIGKRYGATTSSGLSVTHKEFRTARDQNILVLPLVDREVMSFKKVYDANKEKNADYPSVDNPSDLFDFIDEIMTYEKNNGIIQYRTTSEARLHVKEQIAHLVGDLLASESGIESEVTDILAELKVLRRELVSEEERQSLKPFLTVFRRLMSGNYRLSDIIEHMYGELEDGVEPLLESESVGELARSGNYELEVVEELNPLEPDFLRGGGFTTQYGDEDDTGLWAFSRDGVLYVNELALKEYEDELSKLKTELDVNEEQRASSAG